jgi:protein SCO1/2
LNVNGIEAVRIATWAAVAVLGGILLANSGWLPGTRPATEAASSGTARVGGPFELTSHKGETVSNETLAGTPYLVFFGFTHCPDICPTTLYELTDLMDELGPAADRLTTLLVTVDPERDTQDVLAEYMTAFDERFLAVRGSEEETDAVVKAFAAYYRKVPVEPGGYTVDHTAGVILMDADGRFAGTIDMHEPRETVLAKLRRLIDA